MKYNFPKTNFVQKNTTKDQIKHVLSEADEIRETIRNAQSGELQKRLELVDRKYDKIKERQEKAIEMHKRKEADEIRDTISKAQSGKLQKRLEEMEREHGQIETKLEQDIERLSRDNP